MQSQRLLSLVFLMAIVVFLVGCGKQSIQLDQGWSSPAKIADSQEGESGGVDVYKWHDTIMNRKEYLLTRQRPGVRRPSAAFAQLDLFKSARAGALQNLTEVRTVQEEPHFMKNRVDVLDFRISDLKCSTPVGIGKKPTPE